MQQFIEKYNNRINGVQSGLDRFVVRGAPERLNQSYWDPSRQIRVAKGMEDYLWQNGILFKNYSDEVKKISERVKRACYKPLRDKGLQIISIRDTHIDKDELARQEAARLGITSGPVCLISAFEPSPTFDYHKSKIACRIRPCSIYYQYSLDEQL